MHDYAKSVNTRLWYYLMLHEARSPPKFYTSSFKNMCDIYLSVH